MRCLDRTINLKNIKVPFCNVAALFDHIVEFPTALATAHLIGTPPEDQITIKVNGGHVRGIVTPALYPLLEKFIRQYSSSKNRPVGENLVPWSWVFDTRQGSQRLIPCLPFSLIFLSQFNWLSPRTPACRGDQLQIPGAHRVTRKH